MTLALLAAFVWCAVAPNLRAQTYGPAPASYSPALAPAALPSAPAPTGSDPMGVLWSLLGSSPIAGILYLLLRGEQQERRDAVSKMVTMFEADAAHKAELRERLKGQDDLTAKVLDTQSKQVELMRAIDARLSARPGP